MMHSHGLRTATGTLCFLLAAALAGAQDYPSKPLRVIVPSSPGTSSDIAARIIAPTLSKVLGQPVIVENRTGAGMLSGFEYVAKQMPADGYTVSVGSPTILSIMPVTTKDLRFDPLKDLPPVIGLVETRMLFGSSSSLPWKSFNELVAHAKANPGKLNYGTSSANNRLMVEVILRKIGLDIVHVPFSSGGAYIQSVAAGADIHVGFVTDSAAFALGDKFRVLATTGQDRIARLPDVPTFAEMGFPMMPGVIYSFNVRSGTPAPIVQKLYESSSQALRQPEVKVLIEKANFSVLNETPQAAAKSLADHGTFFASVAKQIGLQPN